MIREMLCSSRMQMDWEFNLDLEAGRGLFYKASLYKVNQDPDRSQPPRSMPISVWEWNLQPTWHGYFDREVASCLAVIQLL